MQPKISVIVPIYKAEKYLHRCVDSILAQTFTNFELILVDDGSPDGSGAICDEYAKKDSRIKVFHQENGGPSSARNTGLDNANGDIICFVDCDDIIDDNFLDNFNQKDADIVIQGIYIDNTNNKTWEYIPIIDGYFTKENASTLIKSLWNANNIGYLVTRAFKHKIIKTYNLRLNTEYRLREDEEFIWRYMSYCNTFASVNKGAYRYYVPNFNLKYKNINQNSDSRCTISRIDNIVKLKLCKNILSKIIAYNINKLSTSILYIYKNKEFNALTVKEFINKLCDYYPLAYNSKTLSKKSKFFFYIIGRHTPIFIHKFYRFIFKYIL